MPKTAGEAGRRVGGKDASHRILQRCVSEGGGGQREGPAAARRSANQNAAKNSFKCKFHRFWHRASVKSPQKFQRHPRLCSSKSFCREADDVFTAAHRRHTVSDGRGPQADPGPAGRCGKTGEPILFFSACTGELRAQSNQSGEPLRVKRGFIVAGPELVVVFQTLFKLVLACVFSITSWSCFTPSCSPNWSRSWNWISNTSQ